MTRERASGTPEGFEEDGSALRASGTPEDLLDDGSAHEQELEEEHEESEVERLRRVNQQLLSEKTRSEEVRRQNRELREMMLQMNRTRPDPSEERPGTDWGETVRQLEDSDDPRDKFTLELARELHATRQKLDLIEASEGAKIPAEDRAKVQELLDSGEYRTPRAAYKALLGDRYEQLLARKKAVGDDPPTRDGKPVPRREPVRTVTRSVPREKAASRPVVTAAEYREKLRGPDGPAWRQKRLNNEIEVRTQ